MANINAHLPPSIAVAFHPPTENLQRENLIKPIIPKPEVISSYAKLQKEHQSTRFSSLPHHISQENSQHQEKENYQSALDKKRHRFFMARKELLTVASDIDEISSESKMDLKKVISVIQARYNDAVHPFLDPKLNYTV